MEYINLLLFVVMAWCCYTMTVDAQKSCDANNCVATTKQECNGHGTCECDTCRCNGTYSGPTCEECPTCRTPCEIYQDCVSCKVHMTGNLGFMECIQVCDVIVSLRPMEEAGSGKGMHLCARINEMGCRETFKISGMKDGVRELFAELDMNCNVDPDAPVWVPPTQPATEETTTTQKPTQKPTTQKTTTQKLTTKPTPKATTTEVTTQKSTTQKTTTQKSATQKLTTVEKKKKDEKHVIVEVDDDMNDDGDAKAYDGKPEVAGAVSGGSSEVADANTGTSVDFTVAVVVGLCGFVYAVL